MLQFGDVCVTPFGLARGRDERAANMCKKKRRTRVRRLESPPTLMLSPAEPAGGRRPDRMINAAYDNLMTVSSFVARKVTATQSSNWAKKSFSGANT